MSGVTQVFSDSNATSMVKDELFGYWLRSREDHADLRYFHLSIDGLTVGGDCTNVAICYAPEIQMISYPPPQVGLARTLFFIVSNGGGGRRTWKEVLCVPQSAQRTLQSKQ